MLILLAGVQGRPWAIWVNLGIQLVLIAGWVVSGAVGFIGLVFAGVWLLILYLRSEVKRRAGAWSAAWATAPSPINCGERKLG